MSFKGKTALVTGGTGLIGSNLVRKLLKEGCSRIFVCGRNQDKILNTFDDILPDSRILPLPHDIQKPFSGELGKIDYLFHAAGPISGSEIRQYPVRVVLPNILGIINCCSFIVEQNKKYSEGCKLFVFSSETVYHGAELKEDRICKESDTEYVSHQDGAKSVYLESKRMCETIASSYGVQYGIEYFIGRFGYVYGYSQNRPGTAFYEFISDALADKPFGMNNSSFPRRDNIYVDDAVDGILTVCESGSIGEIYNISSNGDLGNFAGIDEMAAQIERSAKKIGLFPENKALTYADKKIERLPGLRLDNAKLKSLGWTIKTSLEEGISKTLSLYHDEHKNS